MILESDIDCPSKAVHIMNFGEKQVYTVGRRINNDIAISDISVSRNHATFKKEKDKVFLMDLDSKFGTFVKLNEPLKIAKDGSIVPVQIQKKCFFFKQEPRFSQCNRLCNNLPFGSQKKGTVWSDVQRYDYFLRTFDRFPISCRQKLAPILVEIQRAIDYDLAMKQQYH